MIAAGEMASKLFSLFDEYQSKENAKHTQRAMQENARQGYWNGSVPPFGYRAMATDTVGNRGRRKRRLELDPLEAESVREIYRLYLHGRDGNVLGMKAIAAHLNGQGLTMRGHPWRMQKINRLLADPLYSRMLLLQPPRLQDAKGATASGMDRRRRPGHYRCRHLRAGGEAQGKL